MAEEAAEYCRPGFSAVKLKVGFGVDEDARVTHAVREAIGPDIGLMIDANHAYDAVEAIRLGRRIEALDIGWFEEPVPPEDIDGHSQVKAALSIPIAGGECEFTRIGFRPLLARRAWTSCSRTSVPRAGCPNAKRSPTWRWPSASRYAPHVWGTGIAMAAALQLLAVLHPSRRRRCAAAEPMLEFDRTEHPIRQAILQSPIEHANGVVRIPQGPGLGIEVDRTALERFNAH